MPNKNTSTTIDVLKILVPVLLVVIVVVVLQKLFSGIFSGIEGGLQGVGQTFGLGDKIGIFKSDAQKDTLNNVNAYISLYNKNPSENPFLPTYYKALERQGGKTKLFTSAYAQENAKLIHDADGFFVYSPGNFIRGFENCSYKTQVSFIADVYGKSYGNLWEYMCNFIGSSRKEASLLEVFQHVASLPTGLIK